MSASGKATASAIVAAQASPIWAPTSRWLPVTVRTGIVCGVVTNSIVRLAWGPVSWMSDPPPTVALSAPPGKGTKGDEMNAIGFALLAAVVGVAAWALVMRISAELRRIADAGTVRGGETSALRDELAGARRALDELRLGEAERRRREEESWEIVRRLSTVLAGGSSKGRAGENVLRQHLAELPPGMLVTDFRVNGKVVEFGLLLPDGRRLPIDSKWSAV